MFSKKVEKMQASGIRKIFDLIQTMKDPVNLSIGQAHFDVPDEIKAIAVKGIMDGRNKYCQPEGLPELREKLSALIARSTGANPGPVLVTSGAAGALFIAYELLVGKGDEVIVPDPYFIVYVNLCHACGGQVRFLDTYPDFKLTPERLEKAITPRSKLLIFNNPVNPTGVGYTDAEIKAIVEVAKKHDLYIISDEVYDHFTHDFPHSSPLKYYPENTIYINSFSKTLGMAGWRMGYASFPETLFPKALEISRFAYISVPAPFQSAVAGGLDLDLRHLFADYHKKRDLACSMLSDSFDVVVPNGSFYIFPKVPWGTDMQFVEAAVKENVLIVPGSACSERNTHFRISYAVDNSVIEKGMNVLNKLAKRNGASK